MATYGRQRLSSTGDLVQVLADGRPVRPAAGITVDWSTVAAVSGSDATYDDGTVVKVGQKGLPFGTVLTKITQAEVQTIDLSGADDPTGGTFTITIPSYGTTSALAYNASAATVQAALEAVVGAGKVAVGKTGFVYTLTFDGDLGNVSAATVNSASLTSGGTVTVAIGTTTAGTSSSGMYGPYDSGATDGRQTLTRGNVVILNTSVLEVAAGGYAAAATDHPDVIEGGLVWKERVRMGGAGQPSVSALEAVMPLLRYTQ